VYIFSNQPITVFYIGVTSDLEGRVFLHKQGEGGYLLQNTLAIALRTMKIMRMFGMLSQEKAIEKMA
jgi:predicted GIY-YIG superfamily endonuclease